jgi:hypothetical protein
LKGGCSAAHCFELSSEARIDLVLREAVAEVARLATEGGARVSLARLTDQVFLDLAGELEGRGLTKPVIADMFGMALRTYHRRVRQAREAQAERRTVRDSVLEWVRGSGQVSAFEVQQHFLREPGELVAGALHDLVHAGLARRSGWGDKAVYRAVAPQPLSSVALRCGEPVRQIRVASQRR